MHLFRRPSDNRYYAIQKPQRDLLGDLVVVCFNGSSTSHHGTCRTYACEDETAAEVLVEEIGKVREKHGYAPESEKMSK